VEVVEATIPELQEAMSAGDVTSVALVEAYLGRIEAYDRAGPRLNSIVRINPDARADAMALDEERARGEVRGPLHGIPVILKDNYDTYDMPTAASSVALAGLVPPDDGFQVAKLREAGAVILAKSNMHELAVGITTVSSLGGQTRNPYDPARNPGGSSGGTGAAVAASFGAVGWGTDTCGSIRIPSCQNNLFGLRPTKGLSSIDGIIPLSHTQDVGGPLARTVTDLAIALDATVGPDPADPATEALQGRDVPHLVAALDVSALEGARLGIVTALFGEPPDDREVAELLRAAIGQMADLGADTVTVEIPGLSDLARVTGVIDHEFKFDLMDYLAATPGAQVASLEEIVASGLSHAAVRERFERRDQPDSQDTDEYREALGARQDLAAALRGLMDREDLDALVYPGMRRTAAIIGEPQSGSNCQVSAGSGFPALALPAGFTEDGLPVGLELLGRPFDDARLVALAYAFEQAVQPRQAPPATPPLENGRPPNPVSFSAAIFGGEGAGEGTEAAEAEAPDPAAPRAHAELTFDVAAGTLAFDVEISGIPADQLYAVTLNRVDEESAGSVVHRLLGPGHTEGSGTVTLGNRGRADLLEGRLFLVVYSAHSPKGGLRTRLEVPPQ
jgi:Asp-tRNA(Asn)/Glu-tRNA(Gln) amidotransferase A subunit family amidase